MASTYHAPPTQEVKDDVKEQFLTSWGQNVTALKSGELGYVVVLAAKPVEEGGVYL